MNVKWIIEKDVWHPKEEAELIAACDKFGFEHKLVEYLPFIQSVNLGKKFPSDDCVIVSGSIGLTTAVINETTWVPGIYADYPKYACSAYYPVLGDLLLNSEYVLIPFGDLTRLKRMFYEKFGKDHTIFIRPDSGKKLFKGKTVEWDKWDSEMEESKLWGVESSDLVLVSSPQRIDMEWRFFVADCKVFTGCLYVSADFRKEDLYLNKQAEVLAQKAAELYQPDRCFSIDICMQENDMKVLEVNSGTSSGMYDCDIEKIVEEFSKVAWDDYKNYQTLVQAGLTSKKSGV